MTVAAASVLAAGCAGGPDAVDVLRSDAPDMNVVALPPQTDEAIELRDWDVSVARYESGDTIAGGTGFWLETNPEELGEPAEAVLEPAVFLVNVLSLPVSIFLPPPWEAQQYEGVDVPASYTGVPPVPYAADPVERVVTPPSADADVRGGIDLVPSTRAGTAATTRRAPTPVRIAPRATTRPTPNATPRPPARSPRPVFVPANSQSPATRPAGPMNK